MQASEFIRHVQELIDEHGDLEIVMADDTSPTVEYNTDPDPALVIS